MSEKRAAAIKAAAVTQLTVIAEPISKCVVLVVPGIGEMAIQADDIPRLYADIEKALAALGHPPPFRQLTMEERREHIEANLQDSPELRRMLGLLD
jgi:hypothetical protein